MANIFLNLNSRSRYLQWGIKIFVENYYFDRRKLTNKKTTPNINIPFSSKVGTIMAISVAPMFCGLYKRGYDSIGRLEPVIAEERKRASTGDPKPTIG